MKYDSKTYLYYFLQDYLKLDEEHIKRKISLLPEFYLVPGSLKYIDNEDYEKRYVTGNIILDCNYLETMGVKISVYGMEIVCHYKGSKSCINIYIKNGEYQELDFNLLYNSNADRNPNSGLYLFKSKLMSEYDFKNHPGYEFFDQDTVDTLVIKYDLPDESLLYLDDYTLTKYGFEPDTFSFINLEELGCKSISDFLHDVIYKKSVDETISLIKSVDKDNKLNYFQKRFH